MSTQPGSPPSRDKAVRPGTGEGKLTGGRAQPAQIYRIRRSNLPGKGMALIFGAVIGYFLKK